MKRVVVPIMILTVIFLSIICPVSTKAKISHSEPETIAPKYTLEKETKTAFESKVSLLINNSHLLRTVPYIEEEIYAVCESILTTEEYFNMFPEAVRNTFYAMGWKWTKTEYDISPVFGYDHILGLTVWAEKQIYINNTDNANSSILHEVGHAFEYSPYVKGAKSEEFLSLYNMHWQDWYNSYGMHINNYNTPEEGYAQCWEIFILKPWCLDEETRLFIESEIYGIGG